MAESTLSISRSDLDHRIGMRLGYRNEVSALSPSQKKTIDLIRNDALSRFYFPSVPGESLSHDWSFLRIERTLSLTAGVATYTLPDDFSGELVDLQVTSASGKRLVQIVKQSKLTQQRGSESAANSVPLYAAVQVDGHTTSASVGQRCEIEFYPTPDDAYTLAYTASVLPDELTSTLDYYPLGNPRHQQVLIEACLTVAVEYLHPEMPPEQNTHQQRFESLLASAVERDRKQQTSDDLQAVSAPATGTFDWFRREIAGNRFGKWNLHQLSHSENATVERLLISGLNRLYFPMAPGENRFHEWSFLRIEKTLSLTSGTSTYALPAEFGGKLSYLQITSAAGKPRIEVVDQDELTQSRASEAASNAAPLYAAIQTTSHTTSSGVEQRWEIDFYPTPDASYTVTYSPPVLPGEIDTTRTHYPLGTEIHQQALLESVLAVAAVDKNPELSAEQNSHQQRFEQLLAAAISQDSELKKAAALQAVSAPATGTFDWFRREIAGIAFGKWNLYQLSHSENATVEKLMISALNRFYFPSVPGEGSFHEWSFLRIQSTLTTASGTSTYSLPATFGGKLIDLQITSAAGKPLIEVVPQSKLTQSRGSENSANATPLYAAVQVSSVTTDASNEQRCEIEFYPTPDNTYTIAYTSAVLPGEVTSVLDNYPLGNQIHQQLLLESCLAVSFEYRNSNAEQNPHQQQFDRLLAGAVDQDAKLKEAGELEAVAAISAGTFDWFRREIAGKRFNKRNLHQLTHSQKASVEQILTTALNRLYYPLVPGQDRFHEWSFLRIEKTLYTVSGTSTYTLPDEFGGKLRELQLISTTGNSPIEVVRQESLTQQRGSEAADNSTPRYAAIQTVSHTTSATDEQRWEIEFYPTPDDSYAITYTVAVLAGEIDATHTHYPLGTEIHQQALLEAALCAACEQTQPEESERYSQRFEKLLLAAIDQDMKVKKVGDIQAITSLTPGTFDYFRREIGGRVFDKWNVHQLTHGEKATVERLLLSALDRFYRPEMAGDGLYRWSFLDVEYTLTTVADQEDYTLAANHAGVVGPLFCSDSDNVLGEVTKTSVENILSYRSDNATITSQPVFFAERATPGDGTSEQVWELLLWPKPSAVYTLTATQMLSPDTITTSAPYPLGGRAHRETILASCRAVAELETKGKAGAYEADFQKRLSASLQSDMQTHQPEILGYNGNGPGRRARADRRPDGRFENFDTLVYPSGS